MTTLLATLCLNEMEWLPRLYEQHTDWPNVIRWVFVEAADRIYAECNPEMVSEEGLSVDGTTEFLEELAATEFGAVYIPYGFVEHKNPDQGKCAARQRYLDVAEEVRPDFVFVLDADEFYTHNDQRRIQSIMNGDKRHTSFCFPHTHPWRPPSIKDELLFQYGVSGGLWDIGFVRGWRWVPGARYLANHNHIESAGGISLCKKMLDFRNDLTAPTCVHMGFTASIADRRAKHRYYVARGEGEEDGRQEHVDCRRDFETWEPGDKLRHGASVGPYKGPVPECFR